MSHKIYSQIKIDASNYFEIIDFDFLNDEESLDKHIKETREHEETSIYSRNGKEGLITCCPFHQEKTASFIMDFSTGKYNCYGCGKEGEINDLLFQEKKGKICAALFYSALLPSIEKNDLLYLLNQIKDERKDMLDYIMINKVKEDELLIMYFFKNNFFTPCWYNRITL